MPVAPTNRRSFTPEPLKSIAASALGLYLLVNVFLILCLVHPHNTHLQSQVDSHPGSVCDWVHKTVSSHIPSSGILLPLAAAVLLDLLPSLLHYPQTSPIRLTGRSPPQLVLA